MHMMWMPDNKKNKQAALNKLTARRLTEKERWKQLCTLSADQAMELMDTSPLGLSDFMVEASRDYYGANIITKAEKNPLLKRILSSFASPFTGILLLLMVVSLITDVFMEPVGHRDISTVIIIGAMILISGLMRFIQEARSNKAAQTLSQMVKTTIAVTRKGVGKAEIPLDEVVVGDIVALAAGDMVPADVRILSSTDLFINQSAMTGESEPVEKTAQPMDAAQVTTALELPNLAFMGSNVLSGSAVAVVYATGDETALGAMAQTITSAKPEPTAFDKGIASVSKILIRFMLVMVPIVFLLTALTKHNWLGAFLFSISIAVGLTPQMLPMIVSTCLAKGAVTMSRKSTIIKNLNAIQNLGTMDILCTDKTGTLTQDKVVLEYHLDIHGNEDATVLRHAFLNSYYQTGLRSLIDESVIERTQEEGQKDESLRGLSQAYTKVDEIPFDFERRRLSTMVADASGRHLLVTKGAVEEMLSICSSAMDGGQQIPLDDALRQQVLHMVDDLNDDGMRVIAIAIKENPPAAGKLSKADEQDMVLVGCLAFLDPPKETSAAALAALHAHGVQTKILTGDNDRVTASICKKVGLPVENLLLGSQVEQMDDATLQKAAEHTNVFAKLSPGQKARIVALLRKAGHAVGYMGDGINDASAMKAADVGISVDNAVDIAKESAQVILLKKDLMVLDSGLIEGRKVYANLIKYIKMTASSNFGNMLSVLIASALLPFLPMQAVHLLLLNLVYDISCIALPWDNVDAEYLAHPRKWQASSITSFMLRMGPVSSVYDIATYALMFFLICPAVIGQSYWQITDPAVRLQFVALFQAGWFVESMWTQTLVVHMIRTEKIPFVQSRASLPVLLIGLLGCLAVTAIPFTPVGAAIGLAPLPVGYFLWLALILLLYMLSATIAKKAYIRRYGELL